MYSTGCHMQSVQDVPHGHKTECFTETYTPVNEAVIHAYSTRRMARRFRCATRGCTGGRG
jgi:hypothetical protein